MRGDPAAGGLIDNISFQTGVAGNEAWTRDPDGNFYFFGAGNLWRVASGTSSLESLSRGVLDRTFRAIDYGSYAVRLLWDDFEKGVHVYLTPVAQPDEGPIHYFWDQRAGGFWPDQYPSAHGPTATWVYDADLPNDRAMLLGGFDSYLRQLSGTFLPTDDGTAISSQIRYAPKTVGGADLNSLLTSVVPILSEDTTSSATFRIFADGTPQLAATSVTPVVARTIGPGRNSNVQQRVAGNAVCLEIESDDASESWAVESITGIVEPTGRVRHGRM
jgi:hypothetical protein